MGKTSSKKKGAESASDLEDLAIEPPQCSLITDFNLSAETLKSLPDFWRFHLNPPEGAVYKAEVGRPFVD